jgi:hypothetical protein
MKKLENELSTSEYTLIEYNDEYTTKACNDYQILSIYKLLTLCVIHFQEGAINDSKINGIFMEDLLSICLHRLQCFQLTEFKCPENEEAIFCISNALKALRQRTIDRQNRNVLGTEQI